jgi:hypothetical protein
MAAVALLPLACGKAPELTGEAAKDLIVHAPSFQGPWDPGIRFVETENVLAIRDVQRRLLKVESVSLRPDGVWGMAGTTATVAFTWRWMNGPLSGVDYRSKAKLHCARGVWKVYNDLLQEDLWRAERGQE